MMKMEYSRPVCTVQITALIFSKDRCLMKALVQSCFPCLKNRGGLGMMNL